MQTQELSFYIKRKPFRPFSIRLSNGETYVFDKENRLGAPTNISHTIVYFSEDAIVLIDVENITELRD